MRGGALRWMRVSPKGPEPGKRTIPPAVVFSVEDRGLGIDAEDRKHVFEPFYRGAEATERQIHGNGLGLSLVRRIVTAHGGKVTVATRPGAGSAFTIALPVASADARSADVAGDAMQVGVHS